MASSNSSFVIPNITPLVSVKLDGTNYLNWTTQFSPVLRSHDLLSIVDGSETCPSQHLLDSTGKSTSDLNPAYLVWQKKDQFVLAWLNATLSEKILSTVYGLTTSKMVWDALASRFAPQSRSHISHLKRQLQTLLQGTKTCSDYLALAKNWSDQLTAAGKPVDEEDLISYVNGGLNPTYNPFITSLTFATRDKSISFNNFQTELLNLSNYLNLKIKPFPVMALSLPSSPTKQSLTMPRNPNTPPSTASLSTILDLQPIQIPDTPPLSHHPTAPSPPLNSHHAKFVAKIVG